MEIIELFLLIINLLNATAQFVSWMMEHWPILWIWLTERWLPWHPLF